MAADKKQTVKLVAAVALLVIAVVIVAAQRSGTTAGKASGRWFYSLNTGQLVAGPLDGLPKIDTPNGPAVLAHVYTCTTCDEAARQIVYLETLSDEAMTAIAKRDSAPDAAGRALIEGRQLAAPPAAGGDIEWYSNMAPEAVELTMRVSNLCPGAAAKPCHP